jgi:4-hydroxyphenylpyruvate dioxygenase
MRRAIATVCLSGTLEEKLCAAAAAGFDGVELFEPDLVASPLRPAQVRERLAELGLTLDLYQPFRDFEGVAAPDFARAEAKLALMRELGAELLLVCSSVAPDAVDDDARPRSCAGWPSAPRPTASGSPTRRSPGAAT